jgi:hypothetical protein
VVANLACAASLAGVAVKAKKGIAGTESGQQFPLTQPSPRRRGCPEERVAWLRIE